jgi:glucose dehydrogenase
MFLRDVKVLLAVVALGAAIGMTGTVAGQAPASPSKPETEWRFFGSDAGATRYSSANQINAANVRDLRVAGAGRRGTSVPGQRTRCRSDARTSARCPLITGARHAESG